MSSTPSINLASLDFAEIKNSLKTYLKNQDRFNDVDFEGSNINVLLDVLAYNTYLNSFYLNMAINEAFIDTALLRDSVVSHAKQLNYVPRSFKSSRAIINVTITPTSNVGEVVIPFGTPFSSKVGSNTYNFYTSETIAVTSSTNGVFTAANVSIYEGEYVADAFVMNYSEPYQKFRITNPTVDMNSVIVSSIEDSGANTTLYTAASSFLGLDENSRNYFIQSAVGDTYEIYFGDGVIGRRPKDRSIIKITYRTCNGQLPNGASKFAPTGPINGHANVVVTTQLSAAGGDINESIESIRFNAPRNFQVQERAVTTGDYKLLLENKFSSDVRAINVYGGEEAEPPQYGKVVVAVSVADGVALPLYKQEEMRQFLKSRTPLSIDPVFTEPDYVYLDIDGVVRYNLNTTTLTASDIRTLVLSTISNYNNITLSNFDVDFRYSKLVTDIDGCNEAIISNDLYVKPYKVIVPSLTQPNSFKIRFFNKFKQLPSSERVHVYEDEHTIRTTAFTYNGKECTIEDDGVGRLRIVQVSGTSHVTVLSQIGTVDYRAGEITITNLSVTGYVGSGIKFYALTEAKDISAQRNTIMSIKSVDINIDVIGERI